MFLTRVQGNIESELNVHSAGRKQHILMDRFPSVTPEAALGWAMALKEWFSLTVSAEQTPGSMLFLPPKSRRRVGFDEAFGHQQIALDRKAVDYELRAGGERADSYHILVPERVVHENSLVVHDIVPEHSALLFLRGRSVQAGGDQYGDFGVGASGSDLPEKEGERDFTGDCPRMVAGDQRNPLFAFCDFRKPFCADWIFKRLPDDFLLALGGVKLVTFGKQYGFEILFFYM
jgi:hypothetical protein